MDSVANTVVIDVRSGERGSMADWVDTFIHVWEAPVERLERMLALLSDDVVLKAPTRPPESHGKQAGRAAFKRALRALPDLRARVIRWAAADGVLFIEMEFSATVAGRPFTWLNTDRFVFEKGEAVERIAFFRDSGAVFRAMRSRPSGWVQMARLASGF